MVEIEKSANDKRLYRYIKLGNGLQAILISDPDMQVSAGPMDTIGHHTSLESYREDSHDHGHDHGHNHGHNGDCACCEDSESEGQDDSGSDDEAGVANSVKKAGAALAVNVGSFSDPWDIQGLSHYLEHMLFMGSEKFPNENEYDSFLASHAGASNAYTEMEYTNYHFDVSPGHLHSALDRFAQFFIEPLCKADALDREVQAVDNEFTGVRQSDDARLAQLRSHTSKPGHLYRKFTWGNAKSLVDAPRKAGIDIRKRLVEYYKHEYSAERMSLAVLGCDSLDTLESWVTELFSQVPSGKGQKASFQGLERPYEKPRLYLLPSVKEAHNLVMTFQLPSLSERYLAKADDYISSLVGHEGKGSLLSVLKAKGWATGLSAGVSSGGFERNTGLYLFDVTVELAEAGLLQQNGLAAAQLVFEYLALLKREGPQQWVYQELADVGNMKARFKEEQDAADYVAGIVASMQEVQPQHVLVADDAFRDWDPQLITSLLDGMTPGNCRIDLQTSSFQDLKDSVIQLPNAIESEEPWFELPYLEADIPAELVRSWEGASNSIHADLHLPPRNGFIPTDFTLVCDQHSEKQSAEDSNPAKKQKQDGGVGVSTQTNGCATLEDSKLGISEVAPTLEIGEAGLKLWHMLDTTFRTPRSVAYFVISSPKSYESPRAAAMTSLALRLLYDGLKETTYLADVAGLDYAVWPEGALGVELKFSGFSHKLSLLVSTVMEELSAFKASESNFDRVKEAQVLKFRNANIRVQQHAMYLRLCCIKRLWDYNDVLRELESLKVADIQEWIPELWASAHIETLIAGNTSAEAARELARSTAGLFKGQKLASEQRQKDSVAHLPTSSFLLRQPAKNVAEENSAVEIYFQCGENDPRLRAGLDLIEQILSEPCFNVLRTKEQLGYSVHCGVRLTSNVLGFAFAIVSGSHDPTHLEARVEAFLLEYLQDLKKMTEEDFDENRNALIDAKLEKDNCLQDQADRHWDQILNRRYEFHTRLAEVEVLRCITKQRIIDLYEQYLLPGSKHRSRLAVQIVCQKHSDAVNGIQVKADTKILKSPEEFRSSLSHYSAAD